MTRITKIIACLSVLFITACAHPMVPYQSAQPTMAAPPVKVRTDEFSKEVYLDGPMIAYETGPYGLNSDTYQLVTIIDKKTGKVEHHTLVVAQMYGGEWKLYASANDDNATDMKFESVTHDVHCHSGGCTYSELFGVELSDAYLKAHRTAGMRIKFYAKSGESLIISVDPDIIAKQLDAAADQAAALKKKK